MVEVLFASASRQAPPKSCRGFAMDTLDAVLRSASTDARRNVNPCAGAPLGARVSSFTTAKSAETALRNVEASAPSRRPLVVRVAGDASVIGRALCAVVLGRDRVGGRDVGRLGPVSFSFFALDLALPPPVRCGCSPDDRYARTATPRRCRRCHAGGARLGRRCAPTQRRRCERLFHGVRRLGHRQQVALAARFVRFWLALVPVATRDALVSRRAGRLRPRHPVSWPTHRLRDPRRVRCLLQLRARTNARATGPPPSSTRRLLSPPAARHRRAVLVWCGSRVRSHSRQQPVRLRGQPARGALPPPVPRSGPHPTTVTVRGLPGWSLARGGAVPRGRASWSSRRRR